MSTPLRQAIAIHESGHAIMAYYSNHFSVDDFGIEIDDTGENPSRHRACPLHNDNSPNLRNSALERFKIAWAGRVADALAIETNLHNVDMSAYGGYDLDDREMRINEAHANIQRAECEQLMSDVFVLLKKKKNALLKVAEAVFNSNDGKLSGTEIKDIIAHQDALENRASDLFKCT